VLSPGIHQLRNVDLKHPTASTAGEAPNGGWDAWPGCGRAWLCRSSVPPAGRYHEARTTISNCQAGKCLFDHLLPLFLPQTCCSLGLSSWIVAFFGFLVTALSLVLGDCLQMGLGQLWLCPFHGAHSWVFPELLLS